MATISTHNGSSVSQQHNLRNRKITDKEEHIDRNGEHETWVHETEIQAYHRLFDKAQEEYNAKQTRADRQISNYHQKVKEDAKQHTCYEMIIGVYGGQDKQTCKEIMKEFVDTWKERNPNLELIGAYYHNDEQGEPHCHIDYIPVAHGYSRGMETQAGLVKAFAEMGYEKNGKATAQIQWEAKQNEYLEELCLSRGIEVEHPREQDRHHMETELYKAQQQVKELEQEVNALQEQIEAQGGKLLESQEVSAIAESIRDQGLFGKKDYVKLPIDEYKRLIHTAKEIDSVAGREAKIRGKEMLLSRREEELSEKERQLMAKGQDILDAKGLLDEKLSQVAQMEKDLQKALDIVSPKRQEEVKKEASPWLQSKIKKWERASSRSDWDIDR